MVQGQRSAKTGRRIHRATKQANNRFDLCLIDDERWRDQDVIAVQTIHCSTAGVHEEAIGHRLALHRSVQATSRIERSFGRTILHQFDAHE